MHEHDTLPWYRQFWPWLLIALPGTVVVACLITISIALQHDDPLVRDDWYKNGMAINRQRERDDAARALGLQAVLAHEAGGSLQLTLSASQPLPARVQLTLQHPTRKDADLQRVLLLEDGLAHSGPLALPDARHWYITLESLPGDSPAWRLRGRWEPQQHATAVIVPGEAQ